MQYSSRVTAVSRPSDHPDYHDPDVCEQVDRLFDGLFPGQENPEIDGAHAGIAIAALNPALAGHLAGISKFIALELPLCQREDLRELAIQAVNVHPGCDYAYQSRLPVAEGAGISRALQAALSGWEACQDFTEEQRLVVEYTVAVVSGSVSDTLFSRVVEQFGETGAIELSTVASFWAFWAMLLNAAGVEPKQEA